MRKKGIRIARERQRGSDTIKQEDRLKQREGDCQRLRTRQRKIGSERERDKVVANSKALVIRPS
jgi:hypothetical protein